MTNVTHTVTVMDLLELYFDPAQDRDYRILLKQFMKERTPAPNAQRTKNKVNVIPLADDYKP